MNIHPIFVHFPIALLSVYAICEFIRIRKLTNNVAWYAVKTALLFFGVAGAFLALETGDIAEGIWGRSRLVEIHSLWANISTIIFGFLFIIYALTFTHLHFNKQISIKLSQRPWLNEAILKIVRIADTIRKSLLAPILALAGLIAVTITGALGAAIVYGPDLDPIVHAVYSIFFKK